MTDFGRRYGDMYRLTYDTNLDGVVDNSRRLDLHTLPEVRDHFPRTHRLGGVQHTTASLAELNALMLDATLDDAGTARTPFPHGGNHEVGMLDEIDCTGLQGAGGIVLQGMRVTLAAIQNVSTATWTLINLDTIDYDTFPGGSFNTTTHQWTCPALGRYVLALSSGFEPLLPDGKSIGVLMKKDTVLYGPYVRFCTGGADYIRVAAADVQLIAQGAVYDMWVRHDNPTALKLQNLVQYTNYLAIHRIG